MINAKKTLLHNTEAIAIVGMGVVALVTGGYNTIICAVLAGFLIGLTAERKTGSIARAAVVGLIASVITAICGYIYNTYVIKLPEVDNQAPDQIVNYPLFVAVVVGTLVAALVAAIQNIPVEKRRKQGIMIFMLACALLFPFFDQCPTLAWNQFGIGSAIDPTVGCTTQKTLIWVNAAIVTIIFAIQAMGLNIVAGYAGLLDLGYVAFFAIGAYTIGLLNSNHLVDQGVMSADNIFLKYKIMFWIAIWVCAAMAAFFGLMLGAPTLPLRGDYLAIVTLGFGEIIPVAAKNLEVVRIFEPISLFLRQLAAPVGQSLDRIDAYGFFIKNTLCIFGCGPAGLNVTNGTKGISPIFAPSIAGYTFKVGEYVPWYLLALLIMAVSAFFIWRIRDSRIGRAWVSMREDELAANAMGVDLVRTKLLAFIIGAMFSGFAGGFYGSYVSFIEPGSFAFDISVIVLAMVILGGSGNIVGVLVGAFLIKIVDLVVLEKIKQLLNGLIQHFLIVGADNPGLGAFIQRFLDATSFKVLILGLILVVMMKVRPEGLIPAATAKRQA